MKCTGIQLQIVQSVTSEFDVFPIPPGTPPTETTTTTSEVDCKTRVPVPLQPPPPSIALLPCETIYFLSYSASTAAAVCCYHVEQELNYNTTVLLFYNHSLIPPTRGPTSVPPIQPPVGACLLLHSPHYHHQDIDIQLMD